MKQAEFEYVPELLELTKWPDFLLLAQGIYVFPERYERFCQEALQVHQLYCNESYCFRDIPDIWFDDFELVHFIRDVLLKHPAMSLWYPGKNSGTFRWLSAPFK